MTWDRTEPVLCIGSDRKRQQLRLLWVRLGDDAHDDLLLLRTQNDGGRLPIAKNITDDRFIAPLDRWMAVPKFAYGICLGYLRVRYHKEDCTNENSLMEFHVNTLRPTKSRFQFEAFAQLCAFYSPFQAILSDIDSMTMSAPVPG